MPFSSQLANLREKFAILRDDIFDQVRAPPSYFRSHCIRVRLRAPGPEKALLGKPPLKILKVLFVDLKRSYLGL